MRTKFPILFGLIVALSWGVTAQDFGGIITESFDVDTSAESAPSWANNLNLVLYFDWKSDSWQFQSQGSLTHNYRSDQSQLFHADLDIFRFQYVFLGILGDASALQLDVGRFNYTDSSGLVINTNIDQFTSRLDWSTLDATLGAGYSGLVSKYTSRILYNLKDAIDSGDSAIYLASPRLFAWLSLGWEPLPLAKIEAGYLRQQDLRAYVNSQYQPAQDGDLLFKPANPPPFDTNYFLLRFDWGLSNLGLKLGLSGALSQGSSLTHVNLEGYKSIAHLGWAAEGRAEWQILQETGSLQFRGLIASGDPAERTYFYEGGSIGETLSSLSTFRSASPAGIGKVFQPMIGNLALVGLKWSHRPWKTPAFTMWSGLEYSLEVLTSFRMNKGAISVVTNANSDQYYLGTELIASINWNIFSDFSLGMTSAWFVANQGSGGVFQNTREAFESQNSLVLRVIF